MDTQSLLNILTLLGSMIGTIGGICVSNKLVLYRLEQLEKKMEETNDLAERITKLEQDRAVFIEKMENINDKLNEISNSLK